VLPKRVLIQASWMGVIEEKIRGGDHALGVAQTEEEEAAPGGIRRIVFDEGHHLFDAADSAFSGHLTALETAELRKAARLAEARRDLAKAQRAAMRARFAFLDADGDRGLTLAEIGTDAPQLAGRFAVIDRDRSPARRALIEADLVDCMVALPGQLFYSTQIPVCLWFLAKNKGADAKRGFRDRRKQTLFIDARKLGTLIDRVHRELTDADLEKIASTYHVQARDKWRAKAR
jgi:hypothetical protein